MSQQQLSFLEAEPTPVVRGFSAGFIEVSRDSFFATVGELNVTPYPQAPWDRASGYRSDWKAGHGEVVGQSIGGTHLMPNRYAVSPAFFELNHQALVRVSPDRAADAAEV